MSKKTAILEEKASNQTMLSFYNDIYLEVKGDAKRVSKLKKKFAKRTKRMTFHNQLKIEIH